MAASAGTSVESRATVQQESKSDTSQSALEKELAEELGLNPQQGTQDERKEPAISAATLAARRSFFQNMNPNISVVGSVFGNATSFDGVERNIDLGMEESEFAFQAVVDPFAKADFFVTFVKEQEAALNPGADAAAEEEEEEGGFNPELEEAYITFLSLPLSTQLKAGKFRSKFGKINETHPHAYNFIGVPQVYGNFFGGEGLGDEGVGLNWLLPNKRFFQELQIQVTSGPAENASFTRAENNRLLYLAHLKNFFDLNDNTTLELGITGLTGPNNAAGDATNMLAADLTVKWRPLQDRNQSIEWTSEFLLSNRETGRADINSLGFYSHLRYQFAPRWFVGGLFDYSEYPKYSDVHHLAYSGILQFLVTEFEKAELQVKYNNGNFFDSFAEVKLRAVFVIGAHGAHQY